MRKLKKLLLLVLIIWLVNGGISFIKDETLEKGKETVEKTRITTTALTEDALARAKKKLGVENAKEEALSIEDTSFITVSFIDVGQGSSILIEDNGSNMLIDTGAYEGFENLSSFLERENIQTIDTLVLTHPDADHIASAPEIIYGYNVKTIYMSRITNDTKAYENLQKAIQLFGVDVIYPSAGDTIELEKVSLEVVGPLFNADYGIEDINSYSIVLRMVNGNDAFLFMGDATGEETDDILSAGFNVSADVYLASHHGSANDGCNSESFISKVNPSVAVISCGENNSYGHPHKETRKAFEDRNLSVYRTDVQGTITMVSSGDGISTTTEK